MASLQKLSIRLPLQNDNTVGTRWRTPGSKGPAAPALEWGSLSVVAGLIANQTTGSSFSHNVRQYLSGTDASSATISVVHVSGDNAASEGWAISGNNLTHAGSNTGSGFFLLRATSSEGSVDSAVLGWTWVAAATDTLAPTIPTVIAVTPAEGELQFSWAQSHDPLAGTSAASGVKDYRLRRNGSLVATINATSPGVSLTASTAQIGSYSPAPAFGFSSSNGGRYSITSAGTGTHNTQTEQAFNRGWSISGDFVMRAKVVQFNAVGGYQYSTAGIMIGSRTQGQPFVYFYQEPTNGGVNRVQLKRRATASTNSSNVANSSSNIGFAFLQVTRTGDNFVCEYSLDNGVTWTQLATTTVSLPQNVFADLSVASQVGGSEVTAIFEQVSITTTARQTYDYATTGAASYTLTARDIANNESAESPSFVGEPEEVAAPTGMRLPAAGHYVSYIGTMSALNRTAFKQGVISLLNHTKVKDNPRIKGVKIHIYWGAAEQGTSVANVTYTQGLNDLREMADAARAVGKKLCVTFFHVVFVGTGANLDEFFPNYIWSNDAVYGWNSMNNGKVTRQWQAATMDRIIAKSIAYATADNGHGVQFQDDPTIEFFSIGETAISVPLNQNGYTISAFKTQIMRAMTAVRAGSPRANWRVSTNYFGSSDDMWDIINHAVTEKFIVGGPDTLPKESIQSNRIFSGTPPDSRVPQWAQTRPVVDFRQKIPFFSDVQTPSLNGHEGDWTAEQLYNFAVNGGTHNVTVNGNTFQVTARGVNPTYFCWAMKEYEQGSTGPTDSGGIKYSTTRLGDGAESIQTFVNRINGVVPETGCPEAYGGCS